MHGRYHTSVTAPPDTVNDAVPDSRYERYPRSVFITHVPSKWDGTTIGQLWYGEMMFVTTHQDMDYWTNYAISIRKELKGSKKKALSKFNDSELGIRLYIETLFGKFNPYDDFKWVYEN